MASRLDSALPVAAMPAQPLVSCIMPTRQRRHFVARAIQYFLRQDYANRELVVLDDGDDAIGDLIPGDPRISYIRLSRRLRLGAKRNKACELSRGDLIAHWDDDDWYAADRLSRQVAALLAAHADVCGLSEFLTYSPGTGEAWRYRRSAANAAWLAGATLLFRRDAWARRRFADINVGEDAAFVRRHASQRVHVMRQADFYVAVTHGANTSTGRFRSRHWQSCDRADLLEQLGADASFYAMLAPAFAPKPVEQVRPIAVREAELVSCIMPTGDRRRFLARGIEYFLRQDYEQRELIIIDDSKVAVDDLIPADRRIRYYRVPRCSIGAKRNIGCRHAHGGILLCWDDDDWFAPDRISRQVAPILSGAADLTALDRTLLLQLATGECWSYDRTVQEKLFFAGVVSGTLTFRARDWRRVGGFPDRSLAEDAGFVRRLLKHGAKLQKLPNPNTFIYVRHNTNSWQVNPSGPGWARVPVPAALPPEDVAFYEALAHDLALMPHEAASNLRDHERVLSKME